MRRTWKEQRKNANAEQLRLRRKVAPRSSVFCCELGSRSAVVALGRSRSPVRTVLMRSSVAVSYSSRNLINTFREHLEASQQRRISMDRGDRGDMMDGRNRSAG